MLVLPKKHGVFPPRHTAAVAALASMFKFISQPCVLLVSILANFAAVPSRVPPRARKQTFRNSPFRRPLNIPLWMSPATN